MNMGEEAWDFDEPAQRHRFLKVAQIADIRIALEFWVAAFGVEKRL